MRQLWDEGNTNTTEGIGGGGGGGGGSVGHSTGQPATCTGSVASTNTLQRENTIDITSQVEVEKEVSLSHGSYHEKCLSEDMLRDEVLLEVKTISVDNIIISLLVMVLH